MKPRLSLVRSNGLHDRPFHPFGLTYSTVFYESDARSHIRHDSVLATWLNDVRMIELARRADVADFGHQRYFLRSQRPPPGQPIILGQRS